MKNNNKYWFKRKRYGWGWTPVTWQGWFSIFIFFAIILFGSLQLPAKPQQPTSQQLLIFASSIVFSIIGLVSVSYLKGPAPRWRWGKNSTDKPDEDF